MERIQLEDFLRMKFLEGLRISPDGRYVAFLQRDCDKEGDTYPASLWVLKTADNSLHRLTESGRARKFIWLDDGMLLMTAADQPDPAETRYVAVNPENGDQRPAFAVPLKVKSIESAGNGYLVVCAENDLRAEEDREENGADWFVLDELPFCANGSNYSTSRRRATLYRFRPDTGELCQLTGPLYHTEGYTVCREQGKVVCWGQSYDGKRLIMTGLGIVDLQSCRFKELIAAGDWRVEHADMLGDKVMMAATQGLKYNLSENPNYYLVDAETGAIDLYCESDLLAKGLGVASDCRYGGGFDCMVRNGKIYFTAVSMQYCDLWEIPERGVLRKVTHSFGSVDSFDIRGETAWFVGMRGQALQEIFNAQTAEGTEHCRTSFNTDCLSGRSVCAPELCEFTNSHGDLVQGWVLRPAGYEEGRSYPAILDIHGGPKTAYGEVYYHEMQYWANHGYFVFYCNPRGSDGRGNAYGLLIGSYGTYDYDDIMEFTDVVLDRYPMIDRARVGVTGGSYGGFMTNWIVTHTDRFAAAATQRSIADWVQHEGACDSGYWFISHMYKPTSRSNPVAWKQSPLRYAKNAKTPLLVIQSDHDMRCHTGDVLGFYTQLINNGCEIRMCLFKDENHELSRNGRPQSRIKRLEEITTWMDSHLKTEEEL